MMDLGDRLLWLSIGCFIGFVLGYIVRALREIKERVEHVEETVVESAERDLRAEEGLIRHRVAANAALAVVVGLSVWASFVTAEVNSSLQKTLDCITDYNSTQAVALKGRDRAIRSGTDSEVNLWRKYDSLYKEAQKNPKRIPALQKKLHKAISKHRQQLTKLQETREVYAYPSPRAVSDCEEGN